MRKEACSNEAKKSLLTQMFIIIAMIFDLLEQARNQQIILFLLKFIPQVCQSSAEINYSVLRGFHN
jgi:hypothetical protein